jgi:ABC-2 type transport system permease protein
MDAIKYFRLDLKLMKGCYKMYIMLPLLILIFFTTKASVSFLLGYIMFLVLVLSISPFSLESMDGCQKLYYSLPAKVNSMVLGRYLFLFSGISFVILIDIIAGSIYISSGRLTQVEILVLLVSVFFGSIIGLIQYPIFYKFSFEKGRISSTLMYIIPTMLVFIFPSLFSDLISDIDLGKIISYATEHIMLLIAAGLLLLAVAAYISYKVSCAICSNKEI